ncbi:MAG: GNAT family N-acetyltransferase, partial [Pseudomonadota bacterium]|nr:GNAT family N-acetyltransferase [Pseudomonadota bacterium]
ENGNTVSVKVFSSINEVSSAEWDACAGSENPFVSHTFLKTLEDSLAVRAETGWLPQHVVIEDVSGKIIGASPCYLKNHSHGEYVFDWGWADAFERAGGRYYPKLQVSVPFSPVTGPRLLVRNGEDKKRTRQLLTGGLIELANQHSVSSLHITFALEDEWNDLGEMGLLQRKGQQFHWRNRNFKTFDEFLASLNSRKRKMIRKEREAANSAVKIEVLTGDTLTEHHMTAFYGFYLNTVDRKWAHAYLNHDFFQLLRERMSDNIVLVMAQDTHDYVAGALNLRGPTTLWGRNWGCTERFKMLYFEACFYRGIDFAIKNGLSRVEAGAQGPHKISRGYLPSETYSGHWIRDTNFRHAVEDFVDRERLGVQQEMEALSELSPFRRPNQSL